MRHDGPRCSTLCGAKSAKTVGNPASQANTPHNAALRIIGYTGEDAVVGRFVIVLLGCDEPCLDVQRQRLDEADVAVVRSGEGADGSHGKVSVCCSGRAHRSLDGDPWPGERSARSLQARSASEGRR